MIVQIQPDQAFFQGTILAIESSCDETSAAIFQSGVLRSNIINSQISLHESTGGVVPEVAARAHVEAIQPVIKLAIQKAETTLDKIDAVAVTNRPGLLGCLSVGVSAAKALCLSLGIPILGVHHLHAHILSPLASQTEVLFPHLALLVSGGHTELVLVHEIGAYELVGETIDDAAGEAFDKSARLLGLPYPGGKALSELATNGNPIRYSLPRALLSEQGHNFSFSGLKTAVRRLIEVEGEKLIRADAAASIQEAIVSVLVQKAVEAAEIEDVRMITASGGVAANSNLRRQLSESAARQGITTAFAPVELCTDNAAMIGISAGFQLAKGETSGFDLDCFASDDIPRGRATN